MIEPFKIEVPGTTTIEEITTITVKALVQKVSELITENNQLREDLDKVRAFIAKYG